MWKDNILYEDWWIALWGLKAGTRLQWEEKQLSCESEVYGRVSKEHTYLVVSYKINSVTSMKMAGMRKNENLSREGKRLPDTLND